MLGKDKQILQFTSDDFEVLLSIARDYKTCQMASFFLLRLMVLSQHAEPFLPQITTSITDQIYEGLSAFSGVAAFVMSICTLSNMFGTESACRTVLTSPVGGKVIDSALSHLVHERTEVRSMCATLIYNATLHCTKGTSGWQLPESEISEELPELAVQILCGSIEGKPV